MLGLKKAAHRGPDRQRRADRRQEQRMYLRNQVDIQGVER